MAKPLTLKNEPLAASLRDMGFKINRVKPIKDSGDTAAIDVEGTLSSVLRYCEQLDGLPMSVPFNRTYSKESLRDGDNKFKGGTYAKLQDHLKGDIDLKPFEKKRAEIERSGLLDKLNQTATELAKRKKRFANEDEGDFEYDRRDEDMPFMRLGKAPTISPMVDIDLDFSIAWMTTAEDINHYGALAWALIDVIETACINTRVSYVVRVRGLDNDRTLGAEYRILIKEAGEFLAPSMLAACLHTTFYRRAIFALDCAVPDLMELQVSSSLGSPVRAEHVIKFDNGKLRLAPNSVTADAKLIEAEIFKAIGITPSEE